MADGSSATRKVERTDLDTDWCRRYIDSAASQQRTEHASR